MDEAVEPPKRLSFLDRFLANPFVRVLKEFHGLIGMAVWWAAQAGGLLTEPGLAVTFRVQELAAPKGAATLVRTATDATVPTSPASAPKTLAAAPQLFVLD